MTNARFDLYVVEIVSSNGAAGLGEGVMKQFGQGVVLI